MFGISFGEFFVIFIVALIVIGPQKLPETIRTISSLIRQLRTFVDQVKNDVSNELQIDELKQSLLDTKTDLSKKIEETTHLEEIKQSLQETRQSTEQHIRDSQKEIEHSLQHTVEELEDISDYWDDYHSDNEILAPPENYHSKVIHTNFPHGFSTKSADELLDICRARQFDLFQINEKLGNYTAYTLKYSKQRHQEQLPEIIEKYRDRLTDLTHQS